MGDVLSGTVVVEVFPQSGIGCLVEVDDALVAFHSRAGDGGGEKSDGTRLE